MFCLYLVKHWFGNSFYIDCCVPSVTVKSPRHGSKTCVGLIAKSPISSKNTSRSLWPYLSQQKTWLYRLSGLTWPCSFSFWLIILSFFLQPWFCAEWCIISWRKMWKTSLFHPLWFRWGLPLYPSNTILGSLPKFGSTCTSPRMSRRSATG